MTEQKIKSLADLRQAVLLLLCYTAIAACLVMLPIRIYEQHYGLVAGNVLIIGLTSILAYRVKQGAHGVTYFITSVLLLAALTFLTYTGTYSLYAGILFIVLANFSTLFFFDRVIFKISFFILGTSSLLLVLNQFAIPKLEILVAFLLHYGFFYLLSILMPRLETKLKKENTKKEALIQELQARNEDIQLFNNIMAHDIKAPLRNIKGFTSLIERRLKGKLDKDATRVDEYFSFIHTGINSLEQLLEDLLQKSNIESSELQMESIDLEELFQDILLKYQFAIEERQIEISTNNLGTIQGDKGQLSILFSNLISNSIKYQPKQNGHIPKVSISHSGDTYQEVITIEDNGIGIEAEFLESIFEPFKRLHTAAVYEGTGLGLNICKNIVERHEGEIEVISEVGKGTTFKISFPHFSKPDSSIEEPELVL